MKCCNSLSLNQQSVSLPSGLGKTSTLIRFEENCPSNFSHQHDIITELSDGSGCLGSWTKIDGVSSNHRNPYEITANLQICISTKLEMHATKCATLVLDWFPDCMLRGLENNLPTSWSQEEAGQVRDDDQCNSRLLLTSLM